MPIPGSLPGTKRNFLTIHAEGSVKADGSENVITTGSSLLKLSGVIDLSKMEAPDQVVIRQYMRILEGGEDKVYATQTFVGVQTEPLVYLTPKVVGRGCKVTIQQTDGAFKSFDYSFVRED